MNILIIAAHPDDEVLGMGGTIAKHTSQHDNVSIIYMATGISARRELSESEYEIKNIPKKNSRRLATRNWKITTGCKQVCKTS